MKPNPTWPGALKPWAAAALVVGVLLLATVSGTLAVRSDAGWSQATAWYLRLDAATAAGAPAWMWVAAMVTGWLAVQALGGAVGYGIATLTRAKTDAADEDPGEDAAPTRRQIEGTGGEAAAGKHETQLHSLRHP